MPDILLSTLNAKYIHAALDLRYLHANLGALRAAAAHPGAGKFIEATPPRPDALELPCPLYTDICEFCRRCQRNGCR